MRKLVIDGYIADIDDNEIIALTKESNELFDFQDKRSNLSNTIKLPYSSQNHKIFGLAKELTSILRYEGINKRNFYDVQFIQDYTEVIRQGKGKLVSAKDKYELIIYWGNINIKEILGNYTLRDLDLSNLDHDFTLDNAINLDTEVSYPLMNLATDGNLPVGTSGNEIDVGKLVPAVRLHRILKQITKDYHMFFEGITEYESEDNDLLIPIVDRLPLIILEETKDQQLWLGGQTIDVGETAEDKFDLPINGEDEFEVTETGNYKLNFNFVLNWQRKRRGSSLKIASNTFTSSSVVFAELYQDGSWQEFNTFQEAITAIDNGDTVGSRFIYTRDVGLDGDLEFNNPFSRELLINFAEGDKIRWRFIHKIEDDSTFITGTGFHHYFQFNAGSNFKAGFDKLEEGFSYRIAENMPDVKLIDLLKYIAALKGCLVDIYDNSRTIRFITLKSFFENIANSYDLTDKIESIEIESLHCNLGRQNIMKYDNHDDIQEGVGKGTFKILNDTLPVTNHLYQAPFSATINEDWNNLSIAHIPLIDEDELQDVGARILGSQITNREIHYKLGSSTQDVEQDKRIAFWKGSLDFQNIIQNEYKEYVNTMNDFKSVKAVAFLSVKDFNDIDIMKPAVIKQYGYFIINKIHNFVRGQKTIIFLTMLSYPVQPVVYEPPSPPPPPPPLYKVLNLIVRENGIVKISEKVYETGSYTIYIELDTEQTIIAVPAEGYQFYKWTGDVESSSAEIQVTMDTEKSLEAWFTLPRIKLEDSTGEILTEDGKYIYLE